MYSTIILLISMFLSQAANAQYRLLDIDRINMEFARFGCNRDPIIPELDCGDWRGRTSINADLRILSNIYWKNNIHGEGTTAAYKTMGWKFELGINISRYLDLFYLHHSRHVLDQNAATHISYDGKHTMTKFPVEDSYGIRLIFFENARKRSSLIDNVYP